MRSPITLFGTVNEDPNAGACPEEPQMVVTEIDLASPVDDRRLLDGGAAEQPLTADPRGETNTLGLVPVRMTRTIYESEP